MELKKETRRSQLIIEGEQIAEIDFGQSTLRLLYAEIGQFPPHGDLYSVAGLEQYREGVKKLMTAA